MWVFVHGICMYVPVPVYLNACALSSHVYAVIPLPPHTHTPPPPQLDLSPPSPLTFAPTLTHYPFEQPNHDACRLTLLVLLNNSSAIPPHERGFWVPRWEWKSCCLSLTRPSNPYGNIPFGNKETKPLLWFPLPKVSLPLLFGRGSIATEPPIEQDLFPWLSLPP